MCCKFFFLILQIVAINLQKFGYYIVWRRFDKVGVPTSRRYGNLDFEGFETAWYTIELKETAAFCISNDPPALVPTYPMTHTRFLCKSLSSVFFNLHAVLSLPPRAHRHRRRRFSHYEWILTFRNPNGFPST